MIVDTNALSAFAEGNEAVRALLHRAEGPFLPVITVGEYRFGLLSSRERQRRERWLEELTKYWTVLPITIDTARHAEVRQKLKQRATPIPSNDTWIAALALEHGHAILSNDTHFDAVEGLKRLSF